MTDPSRHSRNVEHAVWRVNFLGALLQAHRALARRDEAWRRKEQEYLARLAWAVGEQQRWERMGGVPGHTRAADRLTPAGMQG